jgi:Dockerin type I domain
MLQSRATHAARLCFKNNEDRAMTPSFRGLLCALLFSVLSPLVAANPVDDLLPGHWLEVPNSRLDALDPEDDPLLNPDWPIEAPWHGYEGLPGIMNDWGSAVYDTLRHRLAVWGGGHSGYAGNEIYVFDVETLQWSRITNPTVDVSITGTTLYTDGKPRSRETYNYLQYVPVLDRMVSFGGGNLYPCCIYTLETAAFNFATLNWDTTTYAARPDSGSPFSSIAAVDDATGHVWFIGLGLVTLQEFDPLANQWTTHAEDELLLYRNGAIDPIRRKFVYFGGGAGTIALSLNQPDVSPTLQPTSGDTAIEATEWPGFVYDPVRKVLVWTRIPADPSNTVVPTPRNPNGTNGRFRYVPSKDVYILVNNVSENVYFYRMPVCPDFDHDGVCDSVDDSDGDGVVDALDNCITDPNADQLDADGDGYGNACDADLNNSGLVTTADFGILRSVLGQSTSASPTAAAADLNGSGTVTTADFAILRDKLGTAPGPSGLHLTP